MKGNLLIIGFCFFSVSVFASPWAGLDSIGVERVGDRTFIIHEVSPQETLFGISRRYSTPVNEIVQSNDTLKDGLKIGQRIRVPFVEKAALPEGAFLHQVGQGETLFAISQKYKVSIADLMAWNDLKGHDLSMGQGLIIQRTVTPDPVISNETVEETVTVADQKVAITNQPVDGTNPAAKMPKNSGSSAREEVASAQTRKTTAKPNPAGSPSPTEGPTSDISTIGGWKSHTVVQGETLFSISRQYEAKVEDLITWNALSSNNLSPGQTLKIGRETGASVPVTRYPGPDQHSSANPDPSTGPQVNGATPSSNEAGSTAFKNIKETGQAEVIEGTGNHKKYLVLHRDAPVGTIMRVRNESNDITIFARVVGALPNTGDNNKLIIKVSKAAFDQLKAINSRFPVEISY